MTAPIISLVNALGWTLIHSVWQALVIFAILRLLLALLRRAPAYIRYNLSCWALGGIFVWFLITFYHQWQSLAVQALSVSSAMPAMADLYAPAQVSANATGGVFAIASLLPWVVGLYVAGLLVFIAKVMRDVLALFYIRSSRIQPFDPAWEKYLLKLSGAWHLTQRIRLYLSERIDVPVVIGQLKPIIYLPFSMVTNLTPAQIEAILLHELAHIRRYDFLLNILQTVVETILFFNPFVWWISGSIRTERENCCDDMVLSLTQRKLYAGALLALEENRSYKGRFVLSAAGKKQQLFHRIKRIMEAKTKKMNAIQRLLVLLVLAGSIFSIAWLAPEKKPADKPAAEPVQAMPMAHAAASRIQADTVLPVPAPPAAPTNPAPPAPPPGVPAGMPLPPAPDSLPRGDTAAHRAGSFSWAPFSDSALKKMQNRLQQY
ncbi:MAG TPA: M56 family metallopeptidase, partial [Chitinophagaceae bacterium]|nr:M56 family metallopeptidase [Chitinophagaceae bacterium]